MGRGWLDVGMCLVSGSVEMEQWVAAHQQCVTEDEGMRCCVCVLGCGSDMAHAGAVCSGGRCLGHVMCDAENTVNSFGEGGGVGWKGDTSRVGGGWRVLKFMVRAVVVCHAPGSGSRSWEFRPPNTRACAHQLNATVGLSKRFNMQAGWYLQIEVLYSRGRNWLGLVM